MKATVVLFFFLGMSSLLFCINPKVRLRMRMLLTGLQDQGIYEDAYMVTNAILKVMCGLQCSAVQCSAVQCSAVQCRGPKAA
jgi:hypothetical protein